MRPEEPRQGRHFVARRRFRGFQLRSQRLQHPSRFAAPLTHTPALVFPRRTSNSARLTASSAAHLPRAFIVVCSLLLCLRVGNHNHIKL